MRKKDVQKFIRRLRDNTRFKVDNSRTGGFHEDTLNEVEDAVMIHRSDVAAKAIQYSKEAERASKEFNKEVAQKKRKKLDEIQSKVEENRARKESDKDENIDKRDNSREGGIDQ